MADTVTGRTDVGCTKLLICKSLTSLWRWQRSVLTNWTTSPTCFLTLIGNPRIYWSSSRSIVSPPSPFSTS